MKVFIAFLAAGLQFCSADPSIASGAVSMSTYVGLSEYRVDIKNGFIDVNCVAQCREKVKFHTELIGIPTGIVQQSDKFDSVTILSETGSHYHVMVIYLANNKIRKIFDKYTRSIPNLGVDWDAKPQIDIVLDEKNVMNSNKLTNHQRWIENYDKFEMKSQYYK